MAKIRVHKTSGYTVLSNHALKNKCLSFKAKGLMSVMLGLPDGWEFSVAGLAVLSDKDGRDSVLGGIKELELSGYVKRTRKHDDAGKFAGYEYDIYETPQTEKPCTAKPQPQTDIPQPQTAKPLTEKPCTAKPQQYNKDLLYISSSTKEIKESIARADEPHATPPKKFIKPTLPEISEYIKNNSLNANAEIFYDHFESNGWRVGGKSPMKDWQAALRNWSRRNYNTNTSSAPKYKSELKDNGDGSFSL